MKTIQLRITNREQWGIAIDGIAVSMPGMDEAAADAEIERYISRNPGVYTRLDEILRPTAEAIALRRKQDQEHEAKRAAADAARVASKPQPRKYREPRARHRAPYVASDAAEADELEFWATARIIRNADNTYTITGTPYTVRYSGLTETDHGAPLWDCNCREAFDGKCCEHIQRVDATFAAICAEFGYEYIQ